MSVRRRRQQRSKRRQKARPRKRVKVSNQSEQGGSEEAVGYTDEEGQIEGAAEESQRNDAIQEISEYPSVSSPIVLDHVGTR